MQAPPPLVVRDLVLVGGGHTHVHVLRMFGMRPEPGVRVTMARRLLPHFPSREISKDVHSVYSGMLPGYVEGLYTHEDCHIDLRRLCRFAKARLIVDTASGLDLAGRRVRLAAGRPAVRYDALSLDVGIVPARAEVAGADAHAVPVKPVETFHPRWLQLLERVRAAGGTRAQPVTVAVVGGGAGGVELALAMHAAFAREAPGRAALVLLTRGELLGTHGARVRRIMRQELAARGVRCLEHAVVREVLPGAVLLADGQSVAADEVVWCTQAAAPDWLAATGLDTDDGFVRVTPTLESTSHAGVFAAGDCASVVGFPRPKAGVYAVRQGPPLTRNLRNFFLGRQLRPFAPQSTHLGLLSLGGRRAVASKGSVGAGGSGWLGAALWRWKDSIDRRFMRMYGGDLDAAAARMAAAATPQPPPAAVVAGPEALAAIAAAPMRCGGCGAKVGATTLGRALSRVDAPGRAEVLVGVDGADDAAVVSVPAGMVSVQTVDFFRAFIDDPYTFGRVAAVHAMGDCWAMGATPHAALAIAQVPFGLEAQVEEDLVALMAGAASALREAGCALAGGHSSEGSELALGFSVHGVAAPDALLRKGGLRPGQALVLTKPLGTGVLFAADMRARADGRWVQAALRSMTQESGSAARELLRAGATAATDVTGFGLLGHAVEMARASNVRVTLHVDALPALPGALQLLAAGVTSSLTAANVRLGRAICNQREAAGHKKYALLFDPQTAGGLLAGVAAADADAVVRALRQAGYADATVVGTVDGNLVPGAVECVSLSC